MNKKLSGVKFLSVFEIKEGGIDINNFPAQKDVDEFPKVLAACGVDFQTSSEDSLLEVLKGAGSESCRQYLLVSKLFYKQNTRPASRIVQVIGKFLYLYVLTCMYTGHYQDCRRPLA